MCIRDSHKAEGASNVKKFKVYRYNPDSGQNPHFDTFEIDTDKCCLLYTSRCV